MNKTTDWIFCWSIFVYYFHFTKQFGQKVDVTWKYETKNQLWRTYFYSSRMKWFHIFFVVECSEIMMRLIFGITPYRINCENQREQTLLDTSRSSFRPNWLICAFSDWHRHFRWLRSDVYVNSFHLIYCWMTWMSSRKTENLCRAHLTDAMSFYYVFLIYSFGSDSTFFSPNQ